MFKINNLTYQYDKTRKALDNVSMDFNKGNIIGIIGSNGSGKSTLFNNLMGILKSTEGEILYNGEQIKYDKKSLYNLRKEVGIVFQDPEKQIFYSMVYDDIAFALRNIGIDEKTIKERIHTALEAVNGLQFIDRPVHNLSFGQKKRVAIASVVAALQGQAEKVSRFRADRGRAGGTSAGRVRRLHLSQLSQKRPAVSAAADAADP